MNIEQIYAIESYLSNLLLAKIAYDAGINDVSFLNLSTFNEYSGADDGYFNNFISILGLFYPDIDYLLAYDDEDMEKRHKWMTDANKPLGNIESYLLIRLTDSAVTSIPTNTLHSQFFNSEFAEVQVVEDGFLIIIDMDYGLTDFGELLHALIEEKQSVKRRYHS